MSHRRLVDLILCLLTAPVLVPMFGFFTAAIWLDDRGPILFYQSRLGRHREEFRICKFRTMTASPAFEATKKVTRTGAVLRRTGLDETAQWLNVLRGDMSWIGPRPLTRADIERLGWDHVSHEARFSIHPGVTGLAQLFGGVGASWTRGLDRIYRRKRSLWLDLWIACWSLAINVFGKSRVRAYLMRTCR